MTPTPIPNPITPTIYTTEELVRLLGMEGHPEPETVLRPAQSAFGVRFWSWLAILAGCAAFWIALALSS